MNNINLSQEALEALTNKLKTTNKKVNNLSIVDGSIGITFKNPNGTIDIIVIEDLKDNSIRITERYQQRQYTI